MTSWCFTSFFQIKTWHPDVFFKCWMNIVEAQLLPEFLQVWRRSEKIDLWCAVVFLCLYSFLSYAILSFITNAVHPRMAEYSITHEIKAIAWEKHYFSFTLLLSVFMHVRCKELSGRVQLSKICFYTIENSVAMTSSIFEGILSSSQ